MPEADQRVGDAQLMKAPANLWPAVVALGIVLAFLLGLVALGQSDLAGAILLVMFLALAAFVL